MKCWLHVLTMHFFRYTFRLVTTGLKPFTGSCPESSCVATPTVGGTALSCLVLRVAAPALSLEWNLSAGERDVLIS